MASDRYPRLLATRPTAARPKKAYLSILFRASARANGGLFVVSCVYAKLGMAVSLPKNTFGVFHNLLYLLTSGGQTIPRFFLFVSFFFYIFSFFFIYSFLLIILFTYVVCKVY